MDESRSRTVVFDLSGITVRLSGLPAGVANRANLRWTGFATNPRNDVVLQAEVRISGKPFAEPVVTAKNMVGRFGRAAAAFRMGEGTIRVERDGNAAIRLAPAPGHHQWIAIENLVLAALAWLLPSRGGAVLHAAGIVYRDVAFVLVGSEGSGKTTWSELARSAGAGVLSDDLVFVDASGQVRALSTPFRSHRQAPLGKGSWPLRALLFPVHGVEPALAPVGGLITRARIVANLPFVGERLGAEPDLERTVERLVESVPSRDLTFAIDPSFLEPLADFAEFGGDDRGTTGIGMTERKR